MWRSADQPLPMMMLATTTDESDKKKEKKPELAAGQIDMAEFRKWRSLNLSVTDPDENKTASNDIASNAKKMKLVPRTPIIDTRESQKLRQSKPKRAEPKTLSLSPNIKQDEFEKKKAAAPAKPFKGKQKRAIEGRQRYTHPSSVGVPLEPKQAGSSKREMVKPVQHPFSQHHHVE